MWDESESKVEFMRFFHLALRLTPPHEGRDDEDGSVPIIAKFFEGRGFAPDAAITLEDFWSLVEEKWMNSEAQKEAQSFISMRILFNRVDSNKNRSIEKGELYSAIKNPVDAELGQALAEALGVPPNCSKAAQLEAVTDIFNNLDADGDKLITYVEFRRAVRKWGGFRGFKSHLRRKSIPDVWWKAAIEVNPRGRTPAPPAPIDSDDEFAAEEKIDEPLAMAIVPVDSFDEPPPPPASPMPPRPSSPTPTKPRRNPRSRSDDGSLLKKAAAVASAGKGGERGSLIKYVVRDTLPSCPGRPPGPPLTNAL